MFDNHNCFLNNFIFYKSNVESKRTKSCDKPSRRPDDEDHSGSMYPYTSVSPSFYPSTSVSASVLPGNGRRRATKKHNKVNRKKSTKSNQNKAKNNHNKKNKRKTTKTAGQ